MFRPLRLIMLAILGFLVYWGFFAVPGNNKSETAFDPDQLAARELAVWQSARSGEELPTFLNTVEMLREQYRYSWFRAAHAGYYLARATGQFVPMATRFERVLPDLEEAATVERDWRGATFKPTDAARAQLTWWVTLKMPNLSDNDDVPALIAKDYSIRYGISAGELYETATYRAEAVRLRDSTKLDPDWAAIGKLLSRSYKALHTTLQHATRKPTATS
ncbi:MAG: hypothetical protein ABI051_07430 [Vicinamibacterales bacterium]